MNNDDKILLKFIALSSMCNMYDEMGHRSNKKKDLVEFIDTSISILNKRNENTNIYFSENDKTYFFYRF